MTNEQRIHVYKAIEGEKSLAEIFLGTVEIEWSYYRAHYYATCTEAMEFSLFDKTICGILQIDDSLSIEALGDIMGFNTQDDPSQKKYYDPAEYEILKEALQELADFEMIETGDIYFSSCRLTDIGREYAAKGKKFRTTYAKPFELYFDTTTEQHNLGKDLSRGVVLQSLSIAPEFEILDLELMKSVAELQAPEIYDPVKLNSFKDPEWDEVASAHYLVAFPGAVLYDIHSRQFRVLVCDPKKPFVVQSLTNEFNTDEEWKNEVLQEFLFSGKLSNEDLYQEEEEYFSGLVAHQKAIDEALAENNLSRVKELKSDYFHQFDFFPPEEMILHLEEFISESFMYAAISLPKLGEKWANEVLKFLKVRNDSKGILVTILNEKIEWEVPANLSDALTLLHENPRRFLLSVVEPVTELTLIGKDMAFYFQEDKLNAPVYFMGEEIAYQVPILGRIADRDAVEEHWDEIATQIATFVISGRENRIRTKLAADLPERIDKAYLEKIQRVDEQVKTLQPWAGKEEQAVLRSIAKEKQQKLTQIIQRHYDQFSGQCNELLKDILENPPKAGNEQKIREVEYRIKGLEKVMWQGEEKLLQHLKDEWQKVIAKPGNIPHYVIDTNVLIHQPDIMNSKQQGKVFVLSAKVLDELDKLKRNLALKSRAEQGIRNIRNLKSEGSGLVFELADSSLLPEDFDRNSPDNLILSVALKYKSKNTWLLTSDTGLRLKAEMVGIQALKPEQFHKSNRHRAKSTTTSSQKKGTRKHKRKR